MNTERNSCTTCVHESAAISNEPCNKCDPDTRDKWEISELASLRAFKVACEGQEVAGYFYLHPYGMWVPQFEDNDGLTPLFLHPDPEAAQLRIRVKELEGRLVSSVNHEAVMIRAVYDFAVLLGICRSGAHVDGPTALMLLADITNSLIRDQQVAEACAAAIEDLILQREWLTPSDAAAVINSGEWKKHLKGG